MGKANKKIVRKVVVEVLKEELEKQREINAEILRALKKVHDWFNNEEKWEDVNEFIEQTIKKYDHENGK